MKTAMICFFVWVSFCAVPAQAMEKDSGKSVGETASAAVPVYEGQQRRIITDELLRKLEAEGCRALKNTYFDCPHSAAPFPDPAFLSETLGARDREKCGVSSHGDYFLFGNDNR